MIFTIIKYFRVAFTLSTMLQLQLKRWHCLTLTHEKPIGKTLIISFQTVKITWDGYFIFHSYLASRQGTLKKMLLLYNAEQIY